MSKFWDVFARIVAATLIVLARIVLITVFWNISIAAIFGLPEITAAQSMGLMALFDVLRWDFFTVKEKTNVVKENEET